MTGEAVTFVVTAAELRALTLRGREQAIEAWAVKAWASAGATHSAKTSTPSTSCSNPSRRNGSNVCCAPGGCA